MALDESTPYEIHEIDDKRVVVRIAPICDHPRLTQHESELEELIERFAAVAFDLARTKHIASDWLRWIARLSIQSERTGKTVTLVAANETVRRTRDLIGLSDRLPVLSTLEEAWAQ